MGGFPIEFLFTIKITTRLSRNKKRNNQFHHEGPTKITK